MSTLLAIVVGVLYAAGLYMMMRRSIIKLIIGLALLGHATNLLIFTAGGLSRGQPAFVEQGAKLVPVEAIADPLPQALILTAIVIGFAVQAFLLTLLVLTWRCSQTLEMDELAQEGVH